MKVIIIQSPIIQLNTAYPSGAYLSAFFKEFSKNNPEYEIESVQWIDLNIHLMNRIFSRSGLEKIFLLSEKTALSKIAQAAKSGDFATKTNLENYLLQKENWIDYIDSIMAILKGDFERSHNFLFSPSSPRGSRMMGFLESKESITVDDARLLATYALADLSDYISYVFDENFSLVRYAESIAVSESSFQKIEKSVDSPVLKAFYQPLLEEIFLLEKNFGSESDFSKGNACALKNDSDEKIFVLISVPFAGTFTPSLFTARFFKENFKNSTVSLGGGFINTELRDVSDKEISKYADFLSYDRGYGSYKALFDSGFFGGKKITEPLYKIRHFSSDAIIPQKESEKQYEEYENLLTSTLVPDYSDADFSLYPRVCDNKNPMQRLWSDGSWIKAYLAHGCYWHKCAFCDVTLDYVKSYQMTGIENLYYGLLSQCKKHNVFGIHFVDEALPPAALIKFCQLNLKNGSPLSFWGNIRFEKTYTRDIADFISKGGFIAGSGGIEIATGSGLDKISKGTDLESIVSACCAFKEAGILVHAYMIFGYFGETDQDIINSMETLRQLFCAGLIDSCFWHKFVLTRHSRLYDEWKKGLHKDLIPIDPCENGESGIFSKNGLHFKGEEKSEKFSDGLNASLEAWMNGEGLELPVNEWFDFKTPRPTVKPNLIENAIEKYEEKTALRNKNPLNLEKLFYLGGTILKTEGKLKWNYHQETETLKLSKIFQNPEKNQGKIQKSAGTKNNPNANSASENQAKELSENENLAENFILAMENLSPKKHDPSKLSELLSDKKNAPKIEKLISCFRGRGLVQL